LENSQKPLTRDALISMQVIDANGRIVGKVKDLAFLVGKAGISLTVEKNDGSAQTVDWDQVQAASDFIVLKPVANQSQVPQSTPMTTQQQSSNTLCPTCGQPLTWIAQYQRWYCYNEKKYV
jgi:sporulation protein YlmC with PRC-barrel domain